jgi:hypothetical protein
MEFFWGGFLQLQLYLQLQLAENPQNKKLIYICIIDNQKKNNGSAVEQILLKNLLVYIYIYIFHLKMVRNGRNM